MATFPRKGIELSRQVAITFPAPKWERLANVAQFDNGWKERSSIGLTGRFSEVPITLVVNATDMAAVFTFLQARKLCVESFDLVHPRLGTITVNYVGTQLPFPIEVDGNPPWYRLDIMTEGRF
jgi:hypothetical protein